MFCCDNTVNMVCGRLGYVQNVAFLKNRIMCNMRVLLLVLKIKIHAFPTCFENQDYEKIISPPYCFFAFLNLVKDRNINKYYLTASSRGGCPNCRRRCPIVLPVLCGWLFHVVTQILSFWYRLKRKLLMVYARWSSLWCQRCCMY